MLDHFFPEPHLEAFWLRRQYRESRCRFREYIRLSLLLDSAENCVQRAVSSFFKLILRPTFDAFISRRRKTFSTWSIVSQVIAISAYTRAPIRTAG